MGLMLLRNSISLFLKVLQKTEAKQISIALLSSSHVYLTQSVKLTSYVNKKPKGRELVRCISGLYQQSGFQPLWSANKSTEGPRYAR